MKNDNLTSLEIYMNRVFKSVIIVIPLIAIFAGLTFSVMKILGMYPDVPLELLLMFNASCVLYLLIGRGFFCSCEDEDGLLKPKVVSGGKLFILILIFIQWNFISYMIPSRDFWAYSFLFVCLPAFFLDSRFVAFAITEVAASMAVSWVVRPDVLLPVQDAYFVPEMILRIVLLTLGLFCVWMLTRLVEKQLASELERIADFDTLTLLYTRRKLNKYMYDAAEQCGRTGRPFSVLMVDIDDFKVVNDTYGHACGDEVLKHIADIVRGTAGGSGLAFRYGGEEALVLLYADEEKAVGTAGRICERIYQEKTSYGGKSIQVSVTVGVASFADGDTPESLIRRADDNLYYGKKNGKNCVIV